MFDGFGEAWFLDWPDRRRIWAVLDDLDGTAWDVDELWWFDGAGAAFERLKAAERVCFVMVTRCV